MPDHIITKRRLFPLAGFIAMLFMGCCYAWGIFVVPLEKEFGWLRSETSFAFTLNVLLFSCGVIATGVLSRRVRFATIMRLAAVMIGAGFLLTSFASKIWQIYFTYSFLCGFGIGMGYNCIISTVPQWFPEKPSFITGLMLVGYAVSTAVFSPVISSLITASGIAATFRILAAVCTAGLLLASPWLKVPDAGEKALLPARSAGGPSRSSAGMGVGRMLRTPAFWLDFFMLAFISGSGIAVINHASPLLQEQLHVEPSTAAFVLTAIFLFNATGRVAGGALLDRKGLGPVLLADALAMLAAMAAIWLGTRTSSTPLVIAGSALSLFAFGSNANMIPCTIRELFGQANFAMNYSFVNLSTLIVALMPTAIGAVQLATNGYETPFLLLAALGILDLLLTLILLRTAPRTH